jgi:hypothetical protein
MIMKPKHFFNMQFEFKFDHSEGGNVCVGELKSWNKLAAVSDHKYIHFLG